MITYRFTDCAALSRAHLYGVRVRLVRFDHIVINVLQTGLRPEYFNAIPNQRILQDFSCKWKPTEQVCSDSVVAKLREKL